MGVEAVAETLGSLGDLIPDLIFGPEEEYYQDGEGNPTTAPRDRDQVVVGGSRGAAVKKRGGPGMKVETPPSRRQEEVQDPGTDEETDDWTKED